MKILFYWLFKDLLNDACVYLFISHALNLFVR
jgi:hypothetical protein